MGRAAAEALVTVRTADLAGGGAHPRHGQGRGDRTGSAAVLRGRTVEFGAMIAVLVIGTVVGLGGVWVALVGPTTLILAGSGSLVPHLLALGGGAAWFLLVAPQLFRPTDPAGRPQQDR